MEIKANKLKTDLKTNNQATDGRKKDLCPSGRFHRLLSLHVSSCKEEKRRKYFMLE